MSNSVKLQIDYSPARKQIHFYKLDDDKKYSFDEQDSLKKWAIDRKGKFILNEVIPSLFISDILMPFSDTTEFNEVIFISTHTDCNDFKTMFNQNSGRIIKLTLDESKFEMKKAVDELKNLGERTINEINTTVSKNINLKPKDPSAAEIIQEFNDEINQKGYDLQRLLSEITSDNCLKLCFAGKTSSGKSSFINGLLGKRILREYQSGACTKHVFYIQSPIGKESKSISFVIEGRKVNLDWVENHFEEKGSISEKNIESIKDFLSTIPTTNIEEDQFATVLAHLDTLDNIDSKIQVFYPIPLDDYTDSRFHFILIDTPGTDSADKRDFEFLKKEFNSPIATILIDMFPTSDIDGTGNRVLLQEIAKAEENKSSINFERTIFIINKIDCVKSSEIEDLRLREIEITDSDKNITKIPLRNRKVFYTSGGLNCLSNIESQLDREEKDILDGIRRKAYDNEYGKYYRHSYLGEDKIKTEVLREKANAELDKAIKDNNQKLQDEICSGVWSFEQNMISYGERYALSSKTDQLVNRIISILEYLNEKISGTSDDSEIAAGDFDKTINTLRNTLKDEITKICNAKIEEYNDEKFISKEVFDLGANTKKFNERRSESTKSINKSHKDGIVYTATDKNKEDDFIKMNNENIDQWFEEFKQNAETRLREIQNQLMESIKDKIGEYEEEESKHLASELLDIITAPDAPIFSLEEVLNKIIESKKENHHFVDRVLNSTAGIASTAIDNFNKISKIKDSKIKKYLDKAQDELQKKQDYLQGKIKEKEEDINKWTTSIKLRNEWNKNKKEILESMKSNYKDKIIVLCENTQEFVNSSIERFSTELKAWIVDRETMEKYTQTIDEFRKNLNDIYLKIEQNI